MLLMLCCASGGARSFDFEGLKRIFNSFKCCYVDKEYLKHYSKENTPNPILQPSETLQPSPKDFACRKQAKKLYGKQQNQINRIPYFCRWQAARQHHYQQQYHKKLEKLQELHEYGESIPKVAKVANHEKSWKQMNGNRTLFTVEHK